MSSLVPVDILSALADLGVYATAVGSEDEAKARCPSPDHDDHSPSWSINLESGQHNCFGCGFGGPFLRVVEETQGWTRARCQDWIRKRIVRDTAEGKTRREAKERTYREITPTELWRFSRNFPGHAINNREVSLESLEAYDVRWDADNSAWIIPVMNYETQWVGYQVKYTNSGRSVLNVPTNLKMAGRIFGYPVIPCAPDQHLIVVESPLDAVKLHTIGYDNVVATYGTSFDSEKAEFLMSLGSKFTFFYDDDEAGRNALAKVIKHMGPARTKCYTVAYDPAIKLPGGQVLFPPVTERDPGDLSVSEIDYALSRPYKILNVGFAF